MTTIRKIIRVSNQGGAADITVQLDHGGESTIRVAGEVIEIFHMGKSKSYVVPPWSRPKQSRSLTDTTITSKLES